MLLAFLPIHLPRHRGSAAALPALVHAQRGVPLTMPAGHACRRCRRSISVLSRLPAMQSVNRSAPAGTAGRYLFTGTEDSTVSCSAERLQLGGIQNAEPGKLRSMCNAVCCNSPQVALCAFVWACAPQ
jgi:hypothetical protein